MKQDHLKLAKRHICHLGDEEMANLTEWLRITALTRATLKYADVKMLQGFNRIKGLPKAKGKFVTFKRFTSL